MAVRKAASAGEVTTAAIGHERVRPRTFTHRPAPARAHERPVEVAEP
jgi:hypothetical protein